VTMTLAAPRTDTGFLRKRCICRSKMTTRAIQTTIYRVGASKFIRFG
jgi:hypothetical protein